MFKYAAITHPESLVWNIVEVENKDDIGFMEWPENVLVFVLLNNREDKDTVAVGKSYNHELDKFE